MVAQFWRLNSDGKALTYGLTLPFVEQVSGWSLRAQNLAVGR